MTLPAILPRHQTRALQESGDGVGTDAFRPASAWIGIYGDRCPAIWDRATVVRLFDSIAAAVKTPGAEIQAPRVTGGRGRLAHAAAGRIINSISTGSANVSGWALTHAGPQQAAVVVDAVCMSAVATTAAVAGYFSDGSWTLESAPMDFGRLMDRALLEAGAQWRDSGLLAPVCAAGFEQALRGTLEVTECICLGVKADGEMWLSTEAVIGYIRRTCRG